MPRISIGPLAEAARAAVKGRAGVEVIGDPGAGSRLYTIERNTQRKAMVRTRSRPDNGDTYITASEAIPKGKGFGSAAYLSALEDAAKRGVGLQSDGLVSAEAERIWQKFERLGIPVEKNPNVIREPHGGLTSKGHSRDYWVFRIDRKHIAPALAALTTGAAAVNSAAPRDVLDFDAGGAT